MIKQLVSVFLIIGIASSAGAQRNPEDLIAKENNVSLNSAMSLAKTGKYMPAAAALFSLARRSDMADQKLQLRYTLGEMLMQLKLYQVAAWQFVDIIRAGKSGFTKRAVEQLSIAADNLGDDTILNYAISKMDVADFPASNKDMLYFRMGQVKQKAGDLTVAIQLYSRVSPSSRYYFQALYNKGLALAENKQPESAIKEFRSLVSTRGKVEPTDDIRVAGIAALARTYYQKQDWDEALSMYRRIPRDHEVWHDVLFESSWAYLRAAKFRSALSNFQSLHSTYYEDAYVPESLLLRAIVYLYICKYDEIDKVLTLFEKTYGPARAKMTQFLENSRDPLEYFSEIEKGLQARKDLQIGRKPSYGRLPYAVTRHVIGRADVSNQLEYLRNLYEEKRRLDAMPAGFVASPLGRYSNKIIGNRIKNAKVQIADMMKAHLIRLRAELKDLYEQAGFLRYEMINGKKEQLQKRIAGKVLNEAQIDSDADRDYYVKNGYEYYPFRGEYWLDEIGNFFYLGKQACE